MTEGTERPTASPTEPAAPAPMAAPDGPAPPDGPASHGPAASPGLAASPGPAAPDGPTGQLWPDASGRGRQLAMTFAFNIAGPLAIYAILRRTGMSTVMSLVFSGIPPAIGVTLKVIWHRRLDVVGALVLGGIAVGTVIGLLSHNARLYLLEGSVPTAVFGLACIGSLRARRPLIYRFALEFIGPDTAKGREFAGLWRYQGFRHSFRVMTVVWGAGYLAEAGARVLIVENASTGTALLASKIMPYVFAFGLAIWTTIYGAQGKRRSDQLTAAASAEGGTGHPEDH